MWVLNASEMREADRRTIEERGVPSLVLMENAGRAVVEKMERFVPELRSRTIVVLSGKGGNGGDGLVVLRLLTERGYNVTAYLLARFSELTGDPKENLEKARARALPVHEVPDEEAWAHVLTRIKDAGAVVDALFGTGLSRPPSGLPQRVLRDVRALRAYKVAIDLPSGLSSDSGRVPGDAFSADLTVALAAPKVCHLLPPACFHVGQLEVADIGIPEVVIEASSGRLSTIEPAPLVALLPARHASAHKGDFGHLLVVAGSIGKTGAAVMAARAALRSGCGLVTVACPKSALRLIAPGAPEVMTEPLPETPEGTMAEDAFSRIAELLPGKTALAVGPGISRNPETASLVRRLVRSVTLPLVLDADGLNAFEGERKLLPRGRPLALTPHPGEMGRLLGISSKEVQEDRLDAARRVATENEVSVALKGFRTLVVEPSGRAHIGLTGNPGMATGGTGDVLTGVVGALLAQGLAPSSALQLGVHVHGLSGDLAAEEIGQTALIATDLVTSLPAALLRLGAP